MLQDHELDEIRNILDEEEGVQVAYLYGSYARDQEHEGSDIDIGLVVSESYAVEDALSLGGRLGRRLGREVDARVLNGRDPKFLQNVLRHAKAIYVRDERFRERFEAETTMRYLDMKPHFVRYEKKMKERLTG